MKHALISLVLLFCFYNQLLAQDERSLKLKIKDTVTAYEPAWQLEGESSDTYDSECKCDSMSLTWINQKSGGVIQFFVYTYKSDAEAHAKYESLKKDYGLDEDKAVKSLKLIESDESVLLEGQHNGVKVSELFLRRGRHAAMIFGIGTKYGIAERFASIIALNFPAT